MNDTTKKVQVCLTCGEVIKPHPVNGWDQGNDPWPINQDESLAGRRVCDECNSLYVVPARIGHDVSGTLYDQWAQPIGTFGTEEVSA